MVSFSCDDCGDLLRKQQVDGHVYKCRSGCRSVSCVDCNVSFYGGKKTENEIALLVVELIALLYQ